MVSIIQLAEFQLMTESANNVKVPVSVPARLKAYGILKNPVPTMKFILKKKPLTKPTDFGSFPLCSLLSLVLRTNHDNGVRFMTVTIGLLFRAGTYHVRYGLLLYLWTETETHVHVTSDIILYRVLCVYLGIFYLYYPRYCYRG